MAKIEKAEKKIADIAKGLAKMGKHSLKSQRPSTS
jgi:hypothetical protein